MNTAIGPLEPLLRLEQCEPGSRRLFLTRSVPDEQKLFEIIGGRFAPKRLTVFATSCANHFLASLSDHLRPRQAGYLVFGALFDLPGVRNMYRPEIAFVPYSTWPRGKPLPAGEAWSVVPDLVVEVSGAGDAAAGPLKRVEDYYRAGVRAIWLLRLEYQEVRCYTSPTEVRILTRADDLTGDPVVPGFRLPLAELFPNLAPTP